MSEELRYKGGCRRRVGRCLPPLLVLLLVALACWPWVLPLAVWREATTLWVADPPPHNESLAVDSNGTSYVIPKIIHQTWIDEHIPQKWQLARQSCLDLHPDYQVKLWTDASARELVAKEFPCFLDTYDSYPYAIQRADAIRYLVLYLYGGVYLDLDVECKHSLDYLGQYSFIMPQTMPVGFSNDIMFAAPRHPFMKQLVDALPHWKLWLGSKYPTVMFSTGPMFVTLQATLWPERHSLAVLPNTLYGKYANVDGSSALFKHHHGSSWHSDDAHAVLYLMHHPVLLAVIALILALAGGAWAAALYARRRRQHAAALAQPPELKLC